MYGPCLCGALDCRACRGSEADWYHNEDVRIESSERPWLADSGYSLDEDGTWERRISMKRHLCRRDHKDGRVKKGDIYRVTRTRVIDDESGDGWIRTNKRVLRRAAA